MQVLRIHLESLNIGGSPVVSTPYAQDGDTWRNRVLGGPQARLFSSEAPDGRRARHESERFLADDLVVASLPAMAEMIIEWEDSQDSPSHFWFWQHYNKVYDEFLQHYGYSPQDLFENTKPRQNFTLSAPAPRRRHPSTGHENSIELPSDVQHPGSAREVFLYLLIQRLNHWNRKRAVFGLMPGQLYGLYALGAVFFGRRRIEELAAIEFQRAEWREQLRSTRYPDDGRRLTSHLDEANRRIAHEVGIWYESQRSRIASKGNQINIVDVGFGGLRTARWVLDELIKHRVPGAKIRYIGVDINPDLVQEAEQAVQGITEFADMLGPDGTAPQLECHSIQEWFEKPLANELAGEIDIVLASYSLHHTSSRDFVRRGFLDGTLPMFLMRFLGDTEDDPKPTTDTLLYEAMLKGLIFSESPEPDRTKPAQQLCQIVRRYREARHSWSRRFVPDETYAALVEEFMACLPDARTSLIADLAGLLRPGGVLAIADPNGFSRTFNRQHVIHDWPLVASNFEEWTKVVQRLSALNFDLPEVWRQIRRTDLSVVSLPVEPEMVEAVTSGSDLGEDDYIELFDNLEGEFENTGVDSPPLGPDSIQPLEVEDFHLGYVVVARRRERPARSRGGA